MRESSAPSQQTILSRGNDNSFKVQIKSSSECGVFLKVTMGCNSSKSTETTPSSENKPSDAPQQQTTATTGEEQADTTQKDNVETEHNTEQTTEQTEDTSGGDTAPVTTEQTTTDAEQTEQTANGEAEQAAE